MAPKQLVHSLSKMKADFAIQKIFQADSKDFALGKPSAVLGCDSVFEFKGKVFGKPRNEKEAVNRWLEMSSNYGFLHTGHTLLYKRSNKESSVKNNLL